jgi:hypothetical protein
VSLLIKQGRSADPAGERARERQREIERALRHWREMEAGAITTRARAQAAAKVADWDATMADHIDTHKLTRAHYREQIGAGHIPPPGQVDNLAARLGIPAPEQLTIM